MCEINNDELYCCPLTKQFLKNPVITKYGHTYMKKK